MAVGPFFRTRQEVIEAMDKTMGSPDRNIECERTLIMYSMPIDERDIQEINERRRNLEMLAVEPPSFERDVKVRQIAQASFRSKSSYLGRTPISVIAMYDIEVHDLAEKLLRESGTFEEDCPICLKKMIEKPSMSLGRKELPCGHATHSDCLMVYCIKKSVPSNHIDIFGNYGTRCAKCPVCRVPFLFKRHGPIIAFEK